jgi:hypothetical protein
MQEKYLSNFFNRYFAISQKQHDKFELNICVGNATKNIKDLNSNYGKEMDVKKTRVCSSFLTTKKNLFKKTFKP